MATARNIIKQWFSNFKKPTQEQFWAWLDSFVHKDDKIPMQSVEGLETALQNVPTSDQFGNHLTDGQAHKSLFDSKVDKEDGKGLISDTERALIQENFNKRVVGQTITGDVNKVSTLILEDGSVIQAQFTDVAPAGPDVMLNSLNFNVETGVLTGVKSDGQQLTVDLNGRFALLEHTHAIADVTGLASALNEKAEARHTHSYNDLTDKPTIPEAYNIDAYSTYDYSKFTDLEYNKNLASGKYIATDNDRRLIFFIQNYPDGEASEIPVVQVQMMLQHGSTAMPNLRWIIKQGNGTYVFSNGGSWFQFASTYYVSSRAFVHHGVNPTADQLNDTIGNGVFTIQNYVVPNFPEAETHSGLIVNFKGSNVFTQVFYTANGDMWSRSYINGQWSAWKKLNDFKGLPERFPYGKEFSESSIYIDLNKLKETNTFFLTGSGHKFVSLNGVDNHSVFSFLKCYDGNKVDFAHPSKTIVKLGADEFNGKKGSTAVVSVVNNEILIQINNYE